MDRDNAIEVQNLGKVYHLYTSPQERLKHTLLWRFGKSYGRPFWALNGINFTVKKGETFGIIGKNGSGKSTLLQILAGILFPTEGKVEVSGRIAALLELGSGFNPEFTGRENIYINGAIMGFSRPEMDKKIEDIIAFADIGDFINQPVKLYSSGMFVRLAFSVATSVEADVLLIDEALAVGDIFFRQKCYRRLESLREKGACILLVSHSMNEVEQFCRRALLLSQGHAQFLGPAVEAVKQYYFLDQAERAGVLETARQLDDAPLLDDSSQFTGQPLDWPAAEDFAPVVAASQITQGAAECTRLALCDERGRPASVFQQGETAHFYAEFLLHQDIAVPSGGVEIINDKGIIVHGKNSLLLNTPVPASIKKGSFIRFHQEIKLDVAVSEYSYNVGFATVSEADYQKRADLTNEELDAKTLVLCIVPNAGKFLVIHRKAGHPAQLTHYGAANLPGNIRATCLPADTAGDPQA